MLDLIKQQNARENILMVIANLGVILRNKSGSEDLKADHEKIKITLDNGDIFLFNKGEGFISDHIIIIIKPLNENKLDENEEAMFQSFMLSSLLRDLVDVKKGEKSIFNKLDRNIKNCPPPPYIGDRMEILTAALLTNKNIIFSMPEPPKFFILHNGSSVNIECVSRYINKPKDIDSLLKALLDPIIKKDRYGNSTALFLDSTNVGFHGRFWRDTDYFGTRKICQEAIDKSNFGSLALFNWLIDSETNTYNCFPNYIYSSSISNNLKIFMDSHFKFSNVVQWIEKARIASQGSL